jgi:hypothetical protein
MVERGSGRVTGEIALWYQILKKNPIYMSDFDAGALTPRTEAVD